jgi:WD40 repeat protein/DNA-binding SARP family transcriptional activator
MPELKVFLLGGYRVTVDNAPITAFESDKARALLAYLALNGCKAVRRELLACLLWPDLSQSQANHNLRQVLFSLRNTLAVGGAKTDFLLATHQTVQLHPENKIWVDATQFLKATQALKRCPHCMEDRSDCVDCLPNFEQALEWYQGRILDGVVLPGCEEFNQWSWSQAEFFEQQAIHTLAALTRIHHTCSQPNRMLAHATRWASMHPYDEAAHRAVIRARALIGQRGAALAYYQQIRQLLFDELGIEPTQETQQLYQSILVDERHAIDRPLAAAWPEISLEKLPSPYRGLQPFREQDAVLFFGREAFSHRLAKAVEQYPVTLLVAASGAGKTSTVYAGLLPLLRQEGGFHALVFRPGSHPLAYLASALQTAWGDAPVGVSLPGETSLPGEASSNMAPPNQSPPDQALGSQASSDPAEGYVRKALERFRNEQAGKRKLLMICDQFEEVFALCTEEGLRRQFIDLLLESVQAASGQAIHLLLALRADFMNQTLGLPGLADAAQEHILLLGPMDRQGMVAAITKPASCVEMSFEHGLVTRLLDDVADQPGCLPLLQFTMTLLFDEAQHGVFTHRAYEKIGRLQGALARYADQVYDELDAQEKERARRVFLQLVVPGKTTECTRRVAWRGEFEAQDWSLAQRLAIKRLLVTGVDPYGHETVELVHEALIRGWQRLETWVDEGRAELRMQHLLDNHAQEWQDNGQESGFLLRGGRLDQFAEWAEHGSLILTPLESDFLQASLAARCERQAAEAARQAYEAALEQRSRRFLRSLVIVLGAAALIAIVSSLVTGQQWRRAEQAGWLAFAGQQTAEVAGVAAATEKAVAVSARSEAEGQRAEAEAQRSLAEEQRQSTLQQAAIGLSYAAFNELDSGQQHLGVLLALEALENYPYTWQAELALSLAVQKSRLRLVLNHENIVNWASWSPDGERLSTASDDQTARIWDAYSGELLLTLPHDEMVWRHSWSPDGSRLVVTQGYSGKLVLWEPHTGQRLFEFGHHDAPENLDQVSTRVNHFSWSLSGDRIVTASDDQTAKIWDVQNGQELFTLSGHPGGVAFAAWSPDGARIVTASGFSVGDQDEEQTQVMIWDANSGERLFALPPLTGLANMVAFSPSGDRFAVSVNDDQLQIWDAQTAVALTLIEAETEIVGAAWSPDSLYILARVAQEPFSQVVIWEANTGREVRRLPEMGYLCAAEWSPVGQQILTADIQEGKLVVWDSDQASIIYSMQAHTFKLWTYQGSCSVSWSPSGKRAASASRDGTAMIWDVTPVDSLPIRRSFFRQEGELSNQWVNDVDWNANGDRFLAASFAGVLKVWDATTHEIQFELKVNDDEALEKTSWSHAGDRILACTDRGKVYVWNGVSGNLQLEIQVIEPQISQDMWLFCAWSPDDLKIATAGTDDRAKIWDARTGELLLEYAGHERLSSWIINYDIDWLPNADEPSKFQLVTSGVDKTMQIWDALTGDLIRRIDLFKAIPAIVSPSPDKRRIAVYSFDGLINILDIASGARLQTFPSGQKSVFELAWNPAGTRLAVPNLVGDLLILDAESGAPVTRYLIPGANDAKWSPDGKQLLAAGFGKVLILPSWNSLDELIAYAKSCCVVGELTPGERKRFGLPVKE